MGAGALLPVGRGDASARLGGRAPGVVAVGGGTWSSFTARCNSSALTPLVARTSRLVSVAQLCPASLELPPAMNFKPLA